jgi:hypothetical protein
MCSGGRPGGNAIFGLVGRKSLPPLPWPDDAESDPVTDASRIQDTEASNLFFSMVFGGLPLESVQPDGGTAIIAPAAARIAAAINLPGKGLFI